MTGLPSELHHSCRTTLLRCSEFDSDAAFRAVFVTHELHPFRSGLPEATNKSKRVDACLDYLLERCVSDGRPVLPLFLEALSDRYQAGDALRDELEALADDVQSAFASSGPSPTAVTPRHLAHTQSPATITWLHISDLHFRASQAYDANIVLQAFLRDVDERIQRDGLRPDFVTITGDIAFSGKPAAYDLARRFFDDLLNATGLPHQRLFIVPGNHDVDRSLVSRGAQGLGDSLKDRNSSNAVLATPEDRHLMFARFEGYAEFINSYLGGRLAFDDEHYFYVDVLDLGGRRIALLGLDSAWLCTSDEDKAKGLLIGERQTRAALEQAEGANLKIALLHHPFDWLREFDRNDSEAMLLDNCDFVLHGHLHQTAATQLTSPDGLATVLACGACYETRDFPNMYNWVRLDLAVGIGTVYLRRYSDARGGFWAKDTLTYRNVPDGVYTFALHSKPTLSTMLGVTHDSHEIVYRPEDRPRDTAPGMNLGDLRRLLNQMFDDPRLDAFCMDNYPDVFNKFSRGMRKDEKTNLLLEHCRRAPARRQELLDALERLR